MGFDDDANHRTIDYAMQMAAQSFTAALMHIGGQVSDPRPHIRLWPVLIRSNLTPIERLL
jgi:hypothetical protein